MTLQERLTELIQACFTGLWVETHEPDEALAELAQLCHAQNWQLASWDVEAGLNVAGSADGTSGTGQDPLAAIRALSGLAQPQGTTLLVLQNFHRFLGSAEVVQALARQILTGKQARTFIVVLAPLVNIPVELEKLFVVIEHELPDRDQLQQIAQAVATEVGELPAGPELERLLDATLGLTRYEAEAAFSLFAAPPPPAATKPPVPMATPAPARPQAPPVFTPTNPYLAPQGIEINTHAKVTPWPMMATLVGNYFLFVAPIYLVVSIRSSRK